MNVQRSGGGGMGTRSATGAVRRPHICAECGKSFRTGEDLFMHAEVCLLDAFELEASAIQTNVETTPRRSQGEHGKRLLNQETGYAAAPVVQKQESGGGRQSVVDTSAKRASDVGGTDVQPPEGNDTTGGDQFDEEEVVESDEDYEPPPELELAEPPQKKYRRTFPIGEDGKQIRPKMECPTCGLVLYRHNFSTHFRIHTGELPFQCSFCDKRFRTSSALTVHTRCHTGERPYECPHCNYCCITKRNLDRHIINNHVKKSSRPGRLSRDYYTPRPRRPGQSFQMGNLDYGDELDDDTLEDEIDDENLDEAELEEEAGISRNPSGQLGQAESMLSPTGTRAIVNEGDAGRQAANQTPSEASFKRIGVKTVPILDGPKGVYGDPEAENEETSGQQPTADKESTAPEKESTEPEKEVENPAADKESQPQEASN